MPLYECSNCNHTTQADTEPTECDCGSPEWSESVCTECRRVGELCLKCLTDVYEESLGDSVVLEV